MSQFHHTGQKHVTSGFPTSVQNVDIQSIETVSRAERRREGDAERSAPCSSDRSGHYGSSDPKDGNHRPETPCGGVDRSTAEVDWGLRALDGHCLKDLFCISPNFSKTCFCQVILRVDSFAQANVPSSPR